jgi:hypothetical protein
MKKKSAGRQTVKLSESTSRLLDSYAIAAGAAGVSLLALAMSAEGKIIYTPVHHTITRHGSFKIDLNHDGITDFTLQNKFSVNTSTLISGLSIKPAAGNGAEGWTGFQPYAFALKPGGRIGPGQYFPGKQMASIDAGPAATYYVGSWVNVKNRYLGLRFKINGKFHYGWARLSVQVQKYSTTGILTGYAYETIPGKAIIAGATKGPDDAEPTASINRRTSQPGTLGMLALGAPGLSIWRREDEVTSAGTEVGG